jgi:type IV pilus assembly protein PilM
VKLPLRIFSSSSSLRPALACEVTPEGVLAARQGGSEQTVLAFAALAEDVVRPGLDAPNFSDPALVTATLRKALDEVALRDTKLTLVVPDAAVRVLILDFDSLPAKVQEALPIVRFRLRKLVPFDVDDAAMSYQIVSQKQGQTRVLVTAMPAAIRAEYEDAVRAAGYAPGVVLPSTLAALAALPTGDAALVVNRNGLSLTTVIVNGYELLLHRTLELPENESSQREDLAQAVSVAAAYFEDTLHAAPRILYYVGPGGAEDFARQLGAEPDGMVRDLVPTPATGAVSALPKGLAAGVTGALAS